MACHFHIEPFLAYIFEMNIREQPDEITSPPKLKRNEFIQEPSSKFPQDQTSPFLFQHTRDPSPLP